MSELLFSVLRGIYWPLFFAALIGAAFRIREGKWTAFDTLTGASFLILTFLTAALPRLFYGPEAPPAPHRYLLLFVPLYLPLAAHGILQIRKGLKKHSPLCFGLLILLAVHLFYAVCATYLPAVKEYSSETKRNHRHLCLAAAEWIRKDWADRKADKVLPLRHDVYQSGRRPLVETPVSRIGDLCGGQDFPPFLREKGILPDYRILLVPDGGKVTEGGAFRLRTADGAVLLIFRDPESAPAP